MIKKKDVLNALKKVIDPEIGLNVVDLGLIYKVKVDKENRVEIEMTLTTPFCPLSHFLVGQVETKVKKLKPRSVKVKLVFDPPWTPEKMSKKARKLLGL
jgi:metal-sulfur cluster biosynthetic enzyme